MIKNFLLKYKSVILYLVFGFLTTATNIFTYWLVTRIFGFAVIPGTIIAWTVAVIFAYYTNRKWVFMSENFTLQGIFREIISFFTVRIATGIFDIVFMCLFVDVMGFHDVFVKVLSDVFVIISNYVGSKFLVFKR